MLKTTTSSNTPTIERIIDADLTQHIEDTDLFWVTRHGIPTQRTWNELTAHEQQLQREAQARAEYVALFAPCGW